MALSDRTKHVLKVGLAHARAASEIATAIDNATAGVVPAGSISTAELADNAVSAAKLSAGLIYGVSVEDAKTTSVEENIAGLSSAITLVNDLKSVINVHYADVGVGGEEHKASTVSAAIATDDAIDLASLIALASAIQDSYVAHDADAALGSPVDHQAQTSANSLASAVNPTTLATAITVCNDISAKLDLHMADSTSHSAGDSPSVAEADAANGAAILVADSDVASGDLITWSILDNGTGNVTGVSAVAQAGGIVFTFSADPQGDSIISYAALRAAV